MLKIFYKTLLVSLLSGSLLMLDFSYKGALIQMNSLRAETVKTEGIEDNDMMATLTMASVGLIAARLFTYKMTTDVMLAAAGGAAFIAGEILATLKLKEVMKDLETQITRDDKGNIDQKQIETLERLKESYQKAKETANTKKTLQKAAAAAFAAAAIAAIVLKSSETLAFEGCQATLTAAGSSCPMSAGTAASSTAALKSLQAGREAAPTSMTGKSTEVSGLAAFTSAQAALSASLAASAVAYAICPGTCQEATAAACTAAAASIQACSSVAPTCEMTGAYGVFGVISYQPLKPMMSEPVYYSAIPKSENIFANISKFFMSEARADLFSPLGIASSLAIKYLLATNLALSAQIDAFLFTPMKRGMAWAALSALTFAATGATDNQIKKLEANIQKIDQILNSMYALKNGVASTGALGVTNPKIDKTLVINKNVGINTSKNKDIDLKESGGSALPCVTGSNPDKCPSFSSQINAQADIKLMPEYLQTQIGDISKLTDGINGTSKVSGTTLGLAETVGNQQNALRAELKKQQKNLQDKLKAAGVNIDLARESSKLEASMKAAVQKELDAKKTTAGQILSSFGGGRSGSSSAFSSGLATSPTDASKKATDKNSADKAKAVGGGTFAAVPAPTGFDSKLGKDEELEARLAAEQKAADEAAAAASATQTASMDDYEMKNDITQDKESSIFDLISNRYQKSGYPRLFKRIK